MAKEKKPTPRFTAPWLVMLLVGVATVGAMYMLSGGDDDEAEQTRLRKQADETVEVQPVAPRGTIVSASWRTGVQPDEPEVDNGVDWSKVGEAGKKKKHREESLERLMKNFDGLAVQVAPEDDKEAGAKR